MRLGEPAANPYLYLAANIAAGLDGIRRNMEPPPPVSADPYAAEAPLLPGSLSEAVAALDGDEFYRSASGASGHSGASNGSDVSDWEMREYFEFF
jgi:glutamine synthetase